MTTLREEAVRLPEDLRVWALYFADSSDEVGWQPRVFYDDAGDLIAEWSTPDRRVGVILSLKPEDRGWYVATRGFAEEDGSGSDLSALDLSKLVRRN